MGSSHNRALYKCPVTLAQPMGAHHASAEMTALAAGQIPSYLQACDSVASLSAGSLPGIVVRG